MVNVTKIQKSFSDLIWQSKSELPPLKYRLSFTRASAKLLLNRCYCRTPVPETAHGRGLLDPSRGDAACDSTRVKGPLGRSCLPQTQTHTTSSGPAGPPNAKPLEMLEPDLSGISYIPLISPAGPILCHGWKVRNQAVGCRWDDNCRLTRTECPVLPRGLAGAVTASQDMPWLFCKVCRIGSENLGSGWKEQGKKWEVDRKKWLQVVGEHQQEQNSEQSPYRGGDGGGDASQWRDGGETRSSNPNACTSLMVNNCKS